MKEIQNKWQIIETDPQGFQILELSAQKYIFLICYVRQAQELEKTGN